MECPVCHTPTNAKGECVNLDCTAAHRSATRHAARDTAKATAGAVSSSPMAFSSSGAVD